MDDTANRAQSAAIALAVSSVVLGLCEFLPFIDFTPFAIHVFGPLAAIVLGHTARLFARRSGSIGAGRIAAVGLGLGYFFVAFVVVLIILSSLNVVSMR